MPNETAPEGFVFQCRACGKRSKDKYGYEKVDSGYDESCMLNSELAPHIEASPVREGFSAHEVIIEG